MCPECVRCQPLGLFCWMHCVLFVHSFRYDSQTSFIVLLVSACFMFCIFTSGIVCVFLYGKKPRALNWIYFYFSANLKWLIRRVILDALKELSNNHLSWRFFVSKKYEIKIATNLVIIWLRLVACAFFCREFPETFQRIAVLRRKRFNAFSKIQFKRCAAYVLDG